MRPDSGQSERRRIGERFDAAISYDTAASIQRLTARRLLERIEEAFGEKRPGRILEFGCGTGALTILLHEKWPEAELIATDIAPGMLTRAHARCGDGVSFACMDMADPEHADGVDGVFDLVCGNLALQWAENTDAVLAGLAGRLAPGGLLAVSTLMAGSFAEWRAAHAAENTRACIRLYPSFRTLESGWPNISCEAGETIRAVGRWSNETILEQTGSGLAFLRGLRRIGATEPHSGSRPLQPGIMRRVLRRFDESGAAVTWDIAYGLFHMPAGCGVFVTGTDTGVGKTFVSACLTRAWHASYWKPLQTGLAEEDGDTPEIVRLTGADPDRIFSPAETFLAPLSPDAAAKEESRRVCLQKLVLPQTGPGCPLVVEGAGGLMVPVTPPDAARGKPGVMMIDLIAMFGLPVVLVARSGLGTLNHTLLSLEALRLRGIAVFGVVLNGPLNPGNRAAIEEHGNVRVLAELPYVGSVTPESVEHMSRLFPNREKETWLQNG
ncbi:dethiobiotin synthase [Acetobacter fallax]|nr:dethiobiotin synthase [Acetobacter fallax]